MTEVNSAEVAKRANDIGPCMCDGTYSDSERSRSAPAGMEYTGALGRTQTKNSSALYFRLECEVEERCVSEEVEEEEVEEGKISDPLLTSPMLDVVEKEDVEDVEDDEDDMSIESSGIHTPTAPSPSPPAPEPREEDDVAGTTHMKAAVRGACFEPLGAAKGAARMTGPEGDGTVHRTDPDEEDVTGEESEEDDDDAAAELLPLPPAAVPLTIGDNSPPCCMLLIPYAAAPDDTIVDVDVNEEGFVPVVTHGESESARRAAT